MSGKKTETVIVTGASRGLGEALARAFARAGAAVAVCARGREEIEAVAERIRRDGGRCDARAVDVTAAAEVDEWIGAVGERFGAPTVLVNNASLLGTRVPLAEYPPDEWRRTVEVNLNGTFNVTRAVLPWMLVAGRGSIINVSSGASIPPRRRWGAYAVAKSAVDALTLNLAAELEGTGVRANIVDPGAMRTAMRAAAYPSEDPEQLPVPERVTDVFLWLASDAAAEVSGQRFHAQRFRSDVR